MSIKPALTAKEWKDGYIGHEGFGVQVDEGDHLCGDFSIIYDDMACAPAHLIRHGIAALALHGQEFGFTWADVDDELRAAAFMEAHAAHLVDTQGPNGMGAARPYNERAARHRDRADRIESMLPPRDANG